MLAPMLSRTLLGHATTKVLRLLVARTFLLLAFFTPAPAQSTASIEGQVVDQHGAVIPHAQITVSHVGTERVTVTDDAGRYQIPALPAGDYRVEVSSGGFQTLVVDRLTLQVAGRITQNFQLQIGNTSERVTVTSTNGLIEGSTISVGQVVDQRMVEDIPLNGRHFIDLGLLVPGSVTAPQNGVFSAPVRGQGSFALNTAGQREDTVNYLVNGINLNDLSFNIITMLPPIGSLQEFRIDNSTFSVEYGRNSGAIVNIATRSGTNEFHGELFEFFRNDALDARNFFDFNSRSAQPFKRNQFGGSIGGPVFLPRFGDSGSPIGYNGRDQTFFYFTYEALRQRQQVSLNTVVLSDQQRSSVIDPIVRRLVELIPRGNFIDSTGTARFVGSAPVAVVVDQWAIDISHNLSRSVRLQVYYAWQGDDRNEPTLGGNTVPGFGDLRANRKQLLTLNVTQVFNSRLVNEARFGFNRFKNNTSAMAPLNPADFQISNGVSRPIALPQINVAGGFNFGGPRLVGLGRKNASVIVSDTLSLLSGSHALKFGGEYRHFFGSSFLNDPGSFNFASIATFIQGTANSFSITLGDGASNITQRAIDLFVQDNFRWKPNLMLELGLRYSWNITPTEKKNRFVVFDAKRVALVQVGVDVDKIYKQNALNFQPRVGVAWNPFKDGKTSVRAAYALMTEQPMVNAVLNTTTNPPFSAPLTFTQSVRFDTALALADPAGLAPVSVDPNYDNSYVQSWNLNVQRELRQNLAFMIGYFGSKGTHLRISRNINQPVNGARPFVRLSASSPIRPGMLLNNINQVEGSGTSNYNALWTSLQMRFSHQLQFSASYTWAKSIDLNSYSTPIAITAQDSNNFKGERGLSDFDVRHRFVLTGVYELPFKRNRFVEGWQLAGVLQTQTGNPVKLVISNSTINGLANTIRPDVTGPVEMIGTVDRWFDTSAFLAVPRFGGLGRNVIIGPDFANVDLSLLKSTNLGEVVKLQFRVEAFNLFNRANFGQPGSVVGTPGFGRITNTRFPTGDTGSSRQLQLAVKLIL